MLIKNNIVVLLKLFSWGEKWIEWIFNSFSYVTRHPFYEVYCHEAMVVIFTMFIRLHCDWTFELLLMTAKACYKLGSCPMVLYVVTFCIMLQCSVGRCIYWTVHSTVERKLSSLLTVVWSSTTILFFMSIKSRVCFILYDLASGQSVGSLYLHWQCTGSL